MGLIPWDGVRMRLNVVGMGLLFNARADWAAWHLPVGPVGPPARLAATSNVEGGSGTVEKAHGPLARKGGLHLD